MERVRKNNKKRDELGRLITRGLYEEGMILTWYRDKREGWEMQSGLWSPFYINLRPIISHPELYKMATKALSLMLRDNGFTSDKNSKVVGIAMTGIPFAVGMTALFNIPSLFTRKLPDNVKTKKEMESYIAAGHGQHSLIEGRINSGDCLVFVDDIATTFGSIRTAILQTELEIKQKGVKDVKMKDAFVVIDREQGAAEQAGANGFTLHSFIPFATKGTYWLKDSLSRLEYNVITDYLKGPEYYQEEERQLHLFQLARSS